MPGSKLVKNLSPEEEELQRKKEERAALEDQLAELELDLSTIQTVLNAESCNLLPGAS
jgi:septal ring factor EnvC (AmiA/AmiB activator)